MPDILNAVGSAISKLGKCSVFLEALPQGFKAPCFFIREIKRSCARTVGERFHERVEVGISYYPKNKLNAREECHTVAKALFGLLEFVGTDEGLIRGIDKRSEVENGVLSFFVSFEFFTVNKKDAEKMERLEYASRSGAASGLGSRASQTPCRGR